MVYNKTKLAKDTGLSRQIISKVLNGKQKNPRIQTLEKMAVAMGMSVDELRQLTKKEVEEHVCSRSITKGSL